MNSMNTRASNVVKLCPLLVVSLYLVAAARASADTPKDRLQAMAQASQDVASGTSSDPGVGDFVVVIVKLPSNDPRALAKARQDAMKRIGEYLGAEVEASTESRMTESSDSGGRAISSSFFRDYSAVRVNQTLGAVEMLGMVKVGERDAAGFVLSQGAAGRMQQLSEQAVESLKAKGAGKPMEVIGVGFAPIVGGDTGKAKEQAMLQAQRFAVEAAMGASVVGLAVKDSGEDSETFRETCVSNSDGSIATFTVLEEGPEDSNYRVKIRAVVQQGKLLDSYRAHLRTMGDPMFCVDAGGNDTLRQMAVDFFKEKGFRVSEGRDCDWSIVLTPKVNDYADPADPTRKTKRCQISVQVKNRRTGEINAQAGAPMKGICDIDGDADTQARVATENAFKRGRKELHERIDSAILRLAREGRPMKVVVTGIDTGADGSSSLVERLQLRPGLNDVKASVTGGSVVIDLKSVVANDLVAKFVSGDACALMPGSRARIVRADDAGVEIAVVPASPKPAGAP